jgi:alkanesulfonate monooxygenase SsuD/methylene tetrahydromethanopterin reductase-like flavin-dependent oxidoreductase (luciferase family)
MEPILEAERLGYDSVWLSEAWGADATGQGKAAMAVPTELVDDLMLVGPPERIKDRLSAWKDAAAQRHVDTIMVQAGDINALRLLAEECL